MKTDGKIEIRYVKNTDKEFWFLLDNHITSVEFDKKVRDKQGYILLTDNEPVGILRYGLFWDNTPFCNLIYIKKEFQSRGYGKILITYWENQMQKLGYGLLLVSTRSDENAQYFYRALGYQDCGVLNLPNQPVELFLCKYLLKVIYEELSVENFSVSSLDNFQRRQEVFNCWRNVNGEYRLTPVHYIEDWNLSERRKLSLNILKVIKDGGYAYGAKINGEIVGFALLNNSLFGSRNQYIDLAEFYVSLPFRKKGIGKKLFAMACKRAKNAGAEKLYISAHSAEDSIKAYKSFGCVLASEINVCLAEKEPCDLQLEFKLI